MRGEQLPGQGDIRQITAIGVDKGIENDGRAGQDEAFSRFGA